MLAAQLPPTTPSGEAITGSPKKVSFVNDESVNRGAISEDQNFAQCQSDMISTGVLFHMEHFAYLESELFEWPLLLGRYPENFIGKDIDAFGSRWLEVELYLLDFVEGLVEVDSLEPLVLLDVEYTACE